jgi:hypothetical protein
MRAPRSAVVNCTATFAPAGLIWIKLARQSWCNSMRAMLASGRLWTAKVFAIVRIKALERVRTNLLTGRCPLGQ